MCATEVPEVYAVHFLGGGGEGGDGAGFEGEGAVLCGRGDVVDGCGFAAHVQRDFCGGADDLIESGDELGVLSWERMFGVYGTERDAATSGGPRGKPTDGVPGIVRLTRRKWAGTEQRTCRCAGDSWGSGDQWANHGVERYGD